MRREIVDVTHPGWCCPGHDPFPNETYKSNRSKRARSRDIKKEHRFARRVKKQLLLKDVNESSENLERYETIS